MESTAMNNLLAGKRYLLLQGPMGPFLATWHVGWKAKGVRPPTWCLTAAIGFIAVSALSCTIQARQLSLRTG